MAKQNQGKKFEQDILNSVPKNVYKHRIKDSTMRFKGDNNVCDMFLFKDDTLYMLELKSTKASAIPYTSIAPNQFEGLLIASEFLGIKAGFLFNFREYEETYYIDIKEAIEFKNTSNRMSYPIKFAREKGIKIDQTLKRTRYRYDVNKMINDIKQS